MSFDYQTGDPQYYKCLKKRAAQMRKFPTEAEKIVWEFLKSSQLGYKFNRQHIIGNFIVDFICLEKKLIVEIDGEYHGEHSQMVDDAYRTEWLNKNKFRVIRFTNEHVYNDIFGVIEEIKNNLKIENNE